MRRILAVVPITALIVVACGGDPDDIDATHPSPSVEPAASPASSPSADVEPAIFDECTLVTVEELAAMPGARYRDPKLHARTIFPTPGDGWSVHCGYNDSELPIGFKNPTWLGVLVNQTELAIPTSPVVHDDLPMSEAEAVANLGDEAWAAIIWDEDGDFTVPIWASVVARVGTTVIQFDTETEYGDADDPTVPEMDSIIEIVRRVVERLPSEVDLPVEEPHGQCAQVNLELAADMLGTDLSVSRSLIDGDHAGCFYASAEFETAQALGVLKLSGDEGKARWDARRSSDVDEERVLADGVDYLDLGSGTFALRTGDTVLEVQLYGVQALQALSDEHVIFFADLAEALG